MDNDIETLRQKAADLSDALAARIPADLLSRDVIHSNVTQAVDSMLLSSYAPNWSRTQAPKPDHASGCADHPF